MGIGVGPGVVNTGSFPKRMWPGVHTWYGQEYENWGRLYPELYKVDKSDKMAEEYASIAAMGLGVLKSEGGSVSYASFRQGLVTRLVHSIYGLGFIITKEVMADDQYAQKLTEIGTRGLAKSMLELKETLGANVLNNGFSSSSVHTSQDSSTLFSTSHTTVSGATNNNRPTSDVDLSEAGLEQAVIDMEGWFTEEGLKMKANPRRLAIPPALQFTAERILRSPLRVSTADNDINALKNRGILQADVHINPFLTGAKAWFVLTDVDNGLICLERSGFESDADNDFDTGNAKFKVEERYVFDWVDYRGAYGVSPA